MGKKFFISNRWRSPKVIIALFVLEFAFTIPALALFAIADPNLYRTKLQEDGYLNGFNSNPKAALYAAANYRPYTPPIVWGQFITSYNVVISVLSTFLLLVKAVMFILHCWWPGLSAVVHGAQVGLWAYSTYAQSAPDLSDPKRPQNGPPWYISHSCSVTVNKSLVGYCMQAKAAFAVTIIVLVLFSLNTIWAMWSMVPTQAQRLAKQEENDDDDEDYSDYDDYKEEQQWEMQNMQFPKTPVTMTVNGMPPMTPRTQAFKQLGGR